MHYLMRLALTKALGEQPPSVVRKAVSGIAPGYGCSAARKRSRPTSRQLSALSTWSLGCLVMVLGRPHLLRTSQPPGQACGVVDQQWQVLGADRKASSPIVEWYQRDLLGTSVTGETNWQLILAHGISPAKEPSKLSDESVGSRNATPATLQSSWRSRDLPLRSQGESQAARGAFRHLVDRAPRSKPHGGRPSGAGRRNV